MTKPLSLDEVEDYIIYWAQIDDKMTFLTTKKLLRILETARAALKAIDTIQLMVNAQAEDEGLWSLPISGLQSISEAHLQHELRKLHAVIEHCGAPFRAEEKK